MPEFKIEERPLQFVLCIRDKAPEQVTDQIGKAIGELWAFLVRKDIEPAAAPYARTTWQPGTDLEIGFPVATAVHGEGRIVAGELPGGNVAVTIHTGGYENIGETATALRAWIAEQGLTEAGVPWETYLSDPAKVPDRKDWQTELVYPVQ